MTGVQTCALPISHSHFPEEETEAQRGRVSRPPKHPWATPGLEPRSVRTPGRAVPRGQAEPGVLEVEGGGQRAGLAPRGGRGPLTFSLLLLQEGRRLGDAVRDGRDGRGGVHGCRDRERDTGRSRREAGGQPVSVGAGLRREGRGHS